MDLKKLFRGTKPATAAEIQAALDQARAESAAAIAAIDQLRDARAAALLDAPDAEVDRIEADLATRTRELDRADAAATELDRRLAEALELEGQAERDRIHAGGLAAQERGRAALAAYAKIVQQMVAIVTDLQAAEREIKAGNAALRDRGDARSVAPIERPHWAATESIPQHPEWSILSELRLPDPVRSRRWLWPVEEA